MIRNRILSLMLSLACSMMFAYGQTTVPKISVEIDPGSTAFIGDTGLPFDVPFNIRGVVTDGLKKVSMTYKVNTWKNWMQAADKNEQKSTPWPNPGVPKDSKWTVQVGSLYPNTQYTFTF
ncbi:MAG TPA: hypothetical protein VK588_09815, partial [Chitinophagaceae bacterium]|nr:hypothetical protein [Chitinophagaceae bacterium]